MYNIEEILYDLLRLVDLVILSVWFKKYVYIQNIKKTEGCRMKLFKQNVVLCRETKKRPVSHKKICTF